MTAELIETNRLLITPMSMKFATDQYVNWLNDEEVIRYLEVREPYNLEKLQAYLASFSFPNILFWAITLKNGKHIGNIKIDPINAYHNYAEYGILMGEKSEWGKGYAFEASHAVIDFCFNKGIRKMNLGVVANNVPAVNLYKKLGFDIEGRYKSHGLYDGLWCDMLRMAIFNKNV
jgi:ribosomal-protein-alanine N-acetyltransferase